MNVSRFVSFGAAVIFSALQWAPFTALPPQSVRVVGIPVAGNASDGSMPVVVIATHRQ
jgi:hypothetical protein